MRKLRLPLTLLAALAFPVLNAAPAQAQNARSWVASYGSGVTCSRAAPCADFVLALNQTNAGGEINCVDQGEFGGNGAYSLLITKAVTIDCEGVQARITGKNGLPAVYVQAGVNDVVVLRGLDISGYNNVSDGIAIETGAALHVEKCVIHDIGLVPYGRGILLQATSASSMMELYVSDTVVTNNDFSETSVGIMVHPLASNTINKVILNRVEARHNVFGIKADGTNASGGVINMTVRDSVASGNLLNGIVATGNSGGPAILMMIDHSTSSHTKYGYGVIADGPRTTIEMTRSTASGNNIGFGASNGGQLLSYQNNQVTLNSTKGSPTSVLTFD